MPVSTELRLEFFQGGGGAGCKLYWTPPGAGEAVIPADALAHAKGAETRIAWDKAAWRRRGGGGKGGVIGSGWFYDMDYGPVLCDTIQSAEPAGNLAIKGHALKLTAKVGDQTVVGGMCFDADLLRFSAGWTGAFLQLKGVAYDGAHGVPGPITAGTQIFGTPRGCRAGRPARASTIRATSPSVRCRPSRPSSRAPTSTATARCSPTPSAPAAC